MNYLKNANHLLLWPVYQETAENDLFLCNIGVRARYDMSVKELLEVCLEAWQLDKEKQYRLFVVRANQKWEIDLKAEQTIRDCGLRNGDPLEIQAS